MNDYSLEQHRVTANVVRGLAMDGVQLSLIHI